MKFNIIFLSQMRYLVAATSIFAPDTLSRLKLKPLMFPPYTADQIIEILKQRLDIMVEPEQYETIALSELARHIKRIGGDMRQALDILKEAVDIANDHLTQNWMNKAITWGKIQWWRNEMLSLPPHWSFILLITAMLSKKSKFGYTTRGKVLTHYLMVAKEKGFEPISARTVYHAFSKLIDKGFFHVETDLAKKEKFVLDEGDQDRIIEAAKEIEWDGLLA
jgi:cell division control protein 6